MAVHKNTHKLSSMSGGLVPTGKPLTNPNIDMSKISPRKKMGMGQPVSMMIPQSAGIKKVMMK